MPEEDDDALGEMLGERLKESASGSEPDEDAGDDARAEEAERSAEDPDGAGSTDATESTGSTQPAESMKSTQPTQSLSDDDGTAVDDPTSDDGGERDTARSRSPFPLYVTPEIKEAVQNRFEKFNAQRTLDGEPQVEKHKHFMEGLLRAGLDHVDLEAYVLEEYEER